MILKTIELIAIFGLACYLSVITYSLVFGLVVFRSNWAEKIIGLFIAGLALGLFYFIFSHLTVNFN